MRNIGWKIFDYQDKLFNRSLSCSSAMVKRDNIDSDALCSVRSSMFPRYTDSQVPCKKRRITETAKVRFLPVEEVIKLKRGTGTTIRTTNSNPAKCATPASLSLAETPAFKSSSNHREPNDAGDFRAKQGAESGLDMEKESGSVPGKEISQRGGSSDASVSTMVSKDSNSRISHLDRNSAPLLSTKQQLKGASPLLPLIKNNGSPTTRPNLHKGPLNAPALEVIWKGSFEVLDMARFYDFHSDVKICEGFVAHPPATVSRKAYEFSKQIAGVMQFKLHPRCNFWPEKFQVNSPDCRDIALYFYPGKTERSRKKYSSLLKYVDRNDLVLRSQMGCVELLIFSSKLLPVDSQKLDSSFFMWGVYHRLKCK